MLLPRKWALSLGLLAAAPSISVAGPLDAAQPQGAAQVAAQPAERSNQQVAEDIAKSLGQAQLVHKDVRIEFKGGTASITGQIQNAEQHALVSQLISQVASVQKVDNKLELMNAPAAPSPVVKQAVAAKPEGIPQPSVQQVALAKPTSRSNQEVAQDIANSLTSAGLSGYEVEIRYKNGIASLIGEVENQEQAVRAQRACERISGVNQVLNKLTVKGRPVNIQQTAGYSPQAMQQLMAPPMTGLPQQPPVQQMQGYTAAPRQALPRYGHAQQAGHQIYNQPNMPEHAWPSYAQYDNYAAVTYPGMYDASAWPYIGPYYPYPQVPMGWRAATLEWDDGYWNLKFNSRTDKWWWFLNPKNWDE